MIKIASRVINFLFGHSKIKHGKFNPITKTNEYMRIFFCNFYFISFLDFFICCFFCNDYCLVMENGSFFVQAIQERHENSLLKSEIDKLRDENKSLREQINKSCCPNCGTSTVSRDATMTTEEQQLRIENAKLKAEVRS